MLHLHRQNILHAHYKCRILNGGYFLIQVLLNLLLWWHAQRDRAARTCMYALFENAKKNESN